MPQNLRINLGAAVQVGHDPPQKRLAALIAGVFPVFLPK
jgi:hypothetical protein